MARLRALLSLEDSWAETAESLVASNACDPVRVFVKNEPHSQEKVQAGRLRLISSVSAIDQIVERMLFGSQNRGEIATWDSNPSMPGMGLHDEGLEAIKRLVRERSEPLAEADVQGFDWSVQGWEFELEALVRTKLAGCAPTSVFGRLVAARIACLSLSVMVMSDGTAYAQRLRGVMKSGSYLTSATNSRIRWWLALLVGAAWAITMGDDCVESFVENAPDLYLQLGHRLKAYRACDGGFEFCSTWFPDNGQPEPKNWVKMLYRLLCSVPRNDDEEMVLRCAYVHELRNSPHAAHFWRVVSEVGWGASKVIRNAAQSA